MRKLLFFTCIVLFIGCNRTPEGVIPPDKMVDFMVDMHLAESAINMDVKAFREKSTKLELYNDVFKKHGVTKAEMDSSLNYYLAHANTYEKIYKQVIERLDEMHLEAESGKFQDTREFVFADIDGAIQTLDRVERDSIVVEIWRMPRSFSLLEKGDKSTVDFSFLNDTTNHFDFLVLKGDFKLYLNDCSENPETELRVLYADGSEDAVRDSLIKDAHVHSVRLRLPVDANKTVLRVEGELVGHDKCSSGKSVEITNVRLYKMRGHKTEVVEMKNESDTLQTDTLNQIQELDSLPFNPFLKR